jgi:hypothetical protein
MSEEVYDEGEIGFSDEDLKDFIRRDSERLGDLFSVKEQIEKFAWEKLSKHMGVKHSEVLDNKMNRKVFIHRLMTSMFNVFHDLD